MKHTLGIRDQKGWTWCPEWGPGAKVGVPEMGKIKKEIEFLCSYEYHLINIISFLHETYPSSRTSLPILGLPLPLNYFTNSRLTFAYTGLP